MAFYGKDQMTSDKVQGDDEKRKQETFPPDSSPVEPGRNKFGRPSAFKWIFLFLVIAYVLLSHYHAPILTAMGRFLVLEHPARKADLIVCLAGGNIERGLAAADAYRNGLAPEIYVSREERPDSYELLRAKGVSYPESIDLLIHILQGLGVPRSAIATGEEPVKSTLEEAVAVRDFVGKGKGETLILITSPTHSRRAWLTFRKVFEDTDVRILMRPTRYSNFRPETWWAKRKYVRAVIIEYQKLIFYKLRYLI